MLGEIAHIIENVKLSHGVTLVTMYGMDASNREKILRKLSESNINIDMISQSPCFGGDITLSFSLSDMDLPKTLEAAAAFKAEHEKTEVSICSNNLTIAFFGTEIINTPGIAAGIFGEFLAQGINIVLITTSDSSVSCLISKPDEVKAMKMLQEFNLI